MFKQAHVTSLRAPEMGKVCKFFWLQLSNRIANPLWCHQGYLTNMQKAQQCLQHWLEAANNKLKGSFSAITCVLNSQGWKSLKVVRGRSSADPLSQPACVTLNCKDFWSPSPSTRTHGADHLHTGRPWTGHESTSVCCCWGATLPAPRTPPPLTYSSWITPFWREQRGQCSHCRSRQRG